MNKKLVLLSACLLSAGSIYAQQHVTGRVVDEHGSPVSGAVVRVQGTKLVTQTDDNGNFTFSSLPATAKYINITNVGMNPETVSITGNMQVTMKESGDSNLTEAVVVGYGTAKKLGTVVGTVSKVSADKIENKPVTTALDALQGKVAGVQILNNTGDVGNVNGTSTKVRGTGSLNGGNTPLYVIDGMPVGASVFYMLNPNDIESYTVLRDASATSIYGSRAANGVIFVTTKKGHRNEKAVIKIGQSIGWSQLARRIGNPMSSNELLEYELQNGIINGAQYAAYKASGVNTDWQKYYFNDNAPMYNTNFSVAGGSERTTYYTSASYLKKNGLTPSSRFKRYTVRFNLDSRATDWFHYGVNLGLNYDERISDRMFGKFYAGNNGAFSTVTNKPYINPYDKNGRKLDIIPVMNAYNNELWAKLNPRFSNDARLTGTAFIELTPVKGLTLRSQLGVDAADTRTTVIGYPSAPWNDTKDGGFRNEYFSRMSSFTITNTAEYKWELNQDHQLTFLVGQEGIKSQDFGFNSLTQGQSDDRLIELRHGTKAELPDLEGHSTVEYLSFFGRVDYALMNKYFFDVTVRNDRSSRFGANNRSAMFASGGFMWNMKREDFLKDIEWLTDLKFKASMGSTGNSQGIGYYDALTKTGQVLYNGSNGWGLATPENKNLGWETQIQTTIGFSTRLFDRLNLEVNYYNRRTKDMLMDTPLPYTTGFSSQTLNIGSMVNNGIEIQFDVDAVRNWNDLNVNVYGNFTYNADKITKLFYGIKEWKLPSSTLIYKVGQSVTYLLPVRVGVNPANGNIVWAKPGGGTTETYSEDLYQDTGKRLFAPVNGGFGVNASWRGLTLNADFAFVLGKWMVDNVEFFTYNHNFTQNNHDRALRNAWKKPGDITDVPRFGVANRFDTSLLHNSSFLRLKNLSLSYDLPKSWMEATKVIRNVRLSATARNLVTFTKWKGADPEYGGNISRATFPNTREFFLGIEVTF